MIYRDQLEREIRCTETPKRIVSLVPSQTELLVSLGLSEVIVGVTKFCIHPSTIRKEAKVVGGTKIIDYKKIDVLKPDIILCNKEENTKEMVEVLEQTYTVHVSDIESIQDSLEMITQYGIIFNRQKEASALVAEIEVEQNVFVDFLKNKPKKSVLYFIWRNPWMAAGAETFIDHLLALNGFANVLAERSRYPELTEDEIMEFKNLDMILLSSEPFPFSEVHIEEVQKMAPKAKIMIVDGEYFSWYGSRLKDAFNYFKTLH